MSLESIRFKLVEIFPLEPVPDFRLNDAYKADYRTDKSLFEENWTNWKEIEDWQIAKIDGVFSFAPDKAATYFIPRYMQYVIDDLSGAIDRKECRYGEAEDGFIWYLQELKKDGFHLLNEDQTNLVEEFLSEISKDENYKSTLEIGEESLNKKKD